MHFNIHPLLLSVLLLHAPVSSALSEAVKDGLSVRNLTHYAFTLLYSCLVLIMLMLQNLAKDWDGDSRIELAADGKSIQSINRAGEVMDEFAITHTEESELRYEISVQYTPNESKQLQQRACIPLKLPCNNNRHCKSVGCDACLVLDPVGVCYGYS